MSTNERKPYVPLFGEHNINPTPEQTGCAVAGPNGLVCCCERTCTAADQDDAGEKCVFACGIERVELKYHHRVTDFTGIDEDGGRHHLGERFLDPERSYQLDRFHTKRRLHKH